MKPMIFTGRSNRPLAQRIAAALSTSLSQATVTNFPDGELHVEVESEIVDADVYLVQSTASPVAEHLLELLFLADACRRGGAARITAVIPYFGYARQDRRTGPGEPVGGRVVADMLSAKFDRLMTVDLHNPTLEGFFTIPVEHLTAVPLLAENLPLNRGQNPVLVAPDHGAVKLAHRYAEILDLPVVIIHKLRHTAKEVSVRKLTGEIKNRTPVLIDDMIATGGTLAAAIEALLENGARQEVSIIATHALLVGDAVRRLTDLPVRRVMVTDSTTISKETALPLQRIGLADILAAKIRHLRTRD